MREKLAKLNPFIYLLFACFIWAVDIVVRYPLTLKLSHLNIVFFEYLFGFIFVTPWFVKYGKSHLQKLSRGDWGLALFLGALGSALANYFFTLGIQQISPGTYSFIQIFQPFFVIFLAYLLLKEKIDNLYIFWGFWVIVSALLMHSPDLELGLLTLDATTYPTQMAMVIGSMLIWGFCTVIGKALLKTHHPLVVVYTRWMFALLMTFVLLFISGTSLDWSILSNFDNLWRLLFIGIIAGVASMYLYYMALSKLPAGKVSFVELAYPAFGMLFSSFYTYSKITLLQILGFSSFFIFVYILCSSKFTKRQA